MIKVSKECVKKEINPMHLGVLHLTWCTSCHLTILSFIQFAEWQNVTFSSIFVLTIITMLDTAYNQASKDNKTSNNVINLKKGQISDYWRSMQLPINIALIFSNIKSHANSNNVVCFKVSIYAILNNLNFIWRAQDLVLPGLPLLLCS